MSIEMMDIEEFNQGTQIKVIGVGGGGGNAVEHMISTRVQGVEFICANTDAQALSRGAAHKVIQLGTSGLGAGSSNDRLPMRRLVWSGWRGMAGILVQPFWWLWPVMVSLPASLLSSPPRISRWASLNA